MKLTSNEEFGIFGDVLSQMVFQQKLTGHEAALYLKMRGIAFFNLKTKKRNPCKKGAKTLSEELGVRINKIQPKLKSLEKKGLIKPKYFVMVAGELKGFYDLKFIEKNFSRRNIKFVEYKVNLLPGELETRKTYKQKHKNKLKKITPESKV